MAKSKSVAAFVVAGLGLGTALGVALGVFAISPTVSAGGAGGESSIREEHRRALQENQIYQNQNGASDSVINELSPKIVDGSLAQRPVLVLTTAEAVDGDVDAVKNLLRAADTQDAGSIRLTEDFFRQENSDKILSLVSSTLPAGAQLSTDSRDAGTHAGEALGAGLFMDPKTTEPLATSKERATLLQALREAGYIDYEDETILPAQAIVIVTGRGSDGYYTDTLAKLATQLEDTAGSTVVAGRVEQAGEERVIGKLRAGGTKVSTVDSIDRASSRLATVLAVKEQLDGSSGAYGSAPSANSATPAFPKDA